MSWYGTHPEIGKDTAKTLAPPKMCKMCIYYFRVFSTGRYGKEFKDAAHTIFCYRCSHGPSRKVKDYLREKKK